MKTTLTLALLVLQDAARRGMTPLDAALLLALLLAALLRRAGQPRS